jgi:glycosyltransferase involved in cell wall biosynthesis
VSPGRRVGLAWELTSATGWGVYGAALTLGMLDQGLAPLLLKRPGLWTPDPVQAARLAPLLAEQAQLSAQVRAAGKGRLRLPMPVVKTLQPGFVPMHAGQVFYGSENIGVIFFEDTHLRPTDLDRARQLDRILTGSTWNQRLLEGAGLTHARCVLQGVDTARFHPRLRRPSPPGAPLTLWSAGKLERRKGQDLVLAAFRRYVARHPGARLLTAWQNPWPEGARDIGVDGHVDGPPARKGDQLDIEGWALRNGCPPGSVIDLGLRPHAALAAAMASADLAIFASRYESGTNLPAMEALAMGLPVILSENTGHLDLIAEGRCLALPCPHAVPPTQAGVGNEGWGALDPLDLDAALEALTADPARRAALGQAGRIFAESLDWGLQIPRFLAAAGLTRVDGAQPLG